MRAYHCFSYFRLLLLKAIYKLLALQLTRKTKGLIILEPFSFLFSGPSSANAAHVQHATEENRQALMLFAIVVFFLVFNTPRNFLNLYEVIMFEQVKKDYFHGCRSLKFSILLIGTVSHLLLVINSSLNFFLYCLMSTSFRCELRALFTRWMASGMTRGLGMGFRRDGAGGSGGFTTQLTVGGRFSSASAGSPRDGVVGKKSVAAMAATCGGNQTSSEV